MLGSNKGAHPQQPLLATVSGTFRKAIDDVQRDVERLGDAGVLVLSPADPRIVDRFGDFVFVASDQVRHLRTVQARHLAAIEVSDFLWLVAPDGYVGTSAAMEIGFAVARRIPIYCAEVPSDLTLRQWVTVVEGIAGAVERHTGRSRAAPVENLLIDPGRAIQRSHDDLLVAQRGLMGHPSPRETVEATRAIEQLRERLSLL
jgi:hypothetical protein